MAVCLPERHENYLCCHECDLIGIPLALCRRTALTCAPPVRWKAQSWLSAWWSTKLQVRWGFWFGRVYYPYGSSAGCVAVEVEQVVEALLEWGGVGDDASGAGSAALGLVEHHGFLDAG